MLFKLLIALLITKSSFAADFIEVYRQDSRSYPQYCLDLGKTIAFECQEIYQKFLHSNLDLRAYEQPSVGDAGLLVMVHGRNAHPTQW